MAGNKQVKLTTAKNSWLAGKVKCGYCGYSIGVRKSPNTIQYMNCIGRTQYKKCNAVLPTMRLLEFEDMISKEIRTKLTKINIHGKSESDNAINKQIDVLTAEIEGIDQKIRTFLNVAASGNEITVGYINQFIEEHDRVKQDKLQEIEKLHRKLKEDNHEEIEKITNAVARWEELSFDDKRGVAALLINKIVVCADSVEIDWKI